MKQIFLILLVCLIGIRPAGADSIPKNVDVRKLVLNGMWKLIEAHLDRKYGPYTTLSGPYPNEDAREAEENKLEMEAESSVDPNGVVKQVFWYSLLNLRDKAGHPTTVDDECFSPEFVGHIDDIAVALEKASGITGDMTSYARLRALAPPDFAWSWHVMSLIYASGSHLPAANLLACQHSTQAYWVGDYVPSTGGIDVESYFFSAYPPTQYQSGLYGLMVHELTHNLGNGDANEELAYAVSDCVGLGHIFLTSLVHKKISCREFFHSPEFFADEKAVYQELGSTDVLPLK